MMGPSHLGALAFTLIASVLLIFFARRKTKKWELIRKAFATALVLLFLLRWAYACKIGRPILQEELPLELCHWAQALAALALFYPGINKAELLWFWGLSGTLQALITPDLAKDFPDPSYLLFFAAHCGIVIAAFVLVFGLRYYPRRGSAIRCWLYSQLYFWPVLIINLMTGWNYGYLREKPRAGSLLDLLGEWPLYLVWMQVLALLFFLLLELPFRRFSTNSDKGITKSL